MCWASIDRLAGSFVRSLMQPSIHPPKPSNRPPTPLTCLRRWRRRCSPVCSRSCRSTYSTPRTPSSSVRASVCAHVGVGRVYLRMYGRPPCPSTGQPRTYPNPQTPHPQRQTGVEIMRGILRIGTPLVITVGGLVELGKVTSIQSNHKELQQAGKGTTAAIKVRGPFWFG